MFIRTPGFTADKILSINRCTEAAHDMHGKNNACIRGNNRHKLTAEQITRGSRPSSKFTKINKVSVKKAEQFGFILFSFLTLEAEILTI